MVCFNYFFLPVTLTYLKKFSDFVQTCVIHANCRIKHDCKETVEAIYSISLFLKHIKYIWTLLNLCLSPCCSEVSHIVGSKA